MPVNTDQLVLRALKRNDLAQLIELCRQHSEYEGADYCPVGKVKALAGHVFGANPALHCVVVEQGDSLMGYASYMRQFSTWDAQHYLYMDCLYLTDVARGLGLGGRLMQWITKEAVRLNCQQLQWQTPQNNHNAIGFYRHLGALSLNKARFFLSV